MGRTMEEIAASEQLNDKFLNKLWETIFGNGVDSLLSPWEIKGSRKDRASIRQQELRVIKEVELDIAGLISGRKSVTADGRVKNAADPEEISQIGFNPIIEAEEESDEDFVGAANTIGMLRSLKKEVELRELRRSLNIRKIAIFAEQEAEQRLNDAVSDVPVDIDWLARWRTSAQDVYSPELLHFWANVLAGEVIKPYTYSIRALEFLRNISKADVEMLTVAARLSFGDFIYKDAGSYFSEDIHGSIFLILEELGLLAGVNSFPRFKSAKSTIKDHLAVVLQCNNKALFVESDEKQAAIELSVYQITQLGQEVLSLCPFEADVAYIWAVGNDLKQKGYRVQIGDWVGTRGSQGLFTEKVSL